MHRGSGVWMPFSLPTIIKIICLHNNVDGDDIDGNSII